MASPRLTNYLRANRKRLALSQREIAFLLGGESGSKTSRYERLHRTPNLETAFALEAIFKRTASEIFSGLYAKVERDVALRARTLAARIGGLQPNQRNLRKRQALEEIASIANDPE